MGKKKTAASKKQLSQRRSSRGRIITSPANVSTAPTHSPRAVEVLLQTQRRTAPSGGYLTNAHGWGQNNHNI